MALACVDLQGPEMGAVPENDVLAAIRIRSEAIMIAQGDSHRIAFDIISMARDSIPLDPQKIRWTTEEALVVSVTEDGVVYGRSASDGPVRIHVSYEHNFVTRYDSVSVYVTDTVIDANELKLIALDSTRIGYGATFIPRVRVDLYKSGAVVEKGAIIPIRVDEPAKGDIDLTGGPDGEPVYRINNDGNLIGKFWVRASLNLYGNEIADSVQFTGLYGALVSPFVFIQDPYTGQDTSPALLDTIPLKQFQTCTIMTFINTASHPVDILFSDSTASSTGCEAGDLSFLDIFPWPSYGTFIGGNIMNMPPFSLAVRKSNTEDVIVWKVRNSNTAQIIPYFIGHIKQINVED